MAKTMAFQSILFSYIALISIFSISTFPSTRATTYTGFTIDLIHRDSPQSPSHDASLTHSQRLANALQRSFVRANRFNAKKNCSSRLPSSDIINSKGEYLMTYSIGTPPVHSLAIADTGSDTLWTQCKPCKRCFNQTLPFFIPKNSSTYKTIPCKSDACESTPSTTCTKSKHCEYTIGYGDGSSTTGELATETITLGSTKGKGTGVSFHNVIVGCGFDNGGIFDGGESGIVGLGGGKTSLVRQLGDSIGGKFSYCLMPMSDTSKSSKLNFGANAVVSGEGVVSTPLGKKEPDTYYYLTLEAISVGNHRLVNGNSSDPKSVEEDNIIIDSGTTFTMVNADLHNKLVNVFKKLIKMKQIDDPQRVSSLCFYTRKGLDMAPEVTVHFKGADVKLKPQNVFIRTSDYSLCLAFVPSSGVSIYGNIIQGNFLVGYDLVKRTVSFKAKDCSEP